MKNKELKGTRKLSKNFWGFYFLSLKIKIIKIFLILKRKIYDLLEYFCLLIHITKIKNIKYV